MSHSSTPKITPLNLLPSAESSFQIADLVLSVAPVVPGLGPAVQALEIIYESVNKVKTHRGQCAALADEAQKVIITIRANSKRTEKSNLDAAVQMTLATLYGIKSDVNAWKELSWFRGWLLRDEIEKKLDKHAKALVESVGLLGLATLLGTHDVVSELQKGRAEDTEKLDHIGRSVDELKAKFEALYSDLNKPDNDARTREALLQQILELRKAAEASPDLFAPGELKGECTKVGDQPVVCRAYYDIWRGLWLNKLVVAMKLFRGYRPKFDEPDEKNRHRKQRFERQVDLWRSLHNHYILRLHGWCQIDGELFLVSPFLENRDVVTYLSHGKHSDQERLGLIKDILRGIMYLHGLRIIHAALKPSNILVEDDGHAVISDFALAKQIRQDAALPMVTQSASENESFRYQAPEANDEIPLTYAADIYTWAYTSVTILSGNAPLSKYHNIGRMTIAKNRHEALQISDHNCTAWTTYPDLWPLLQSCWASEPEHRPTPEDILPQLERL